MLGTAMICQLKKLLSWVGGLYIMQHSVMEPVVELPAVISLSLSLSMNIHDFQLVFNLCFLNQFTMWVLTGGKSYLGMMSGSFITHTIQ